MKTSALKYAVLTWITTFTMIILFFIPFHGFLTVWLSSFIGHYTALRLWKEALLFLCVIGVIYLLLTDNKIRTHTLTRRLVWTIICFMALNITWGLLALNQHDVTAKALAYGLLIDLRFLVFFLVTWAVALRMGRLKSNWQWIVIWPAVAVVVIGLLQLVLPHDIMKHFGYGPNTIPIEETINHNSHYFRIDSTLRGANPLGAYLIIPISIISVMLLAKRNWRLILLLAASIVVLFFSYSRSAWIGAALATAIVFLTGRLSGQAQKLVIGASAFILVVCLGLFAVYHNNTDFQNYVLHTQTDSAVSSTSNGGHESALKSGLHDVIHEPLGRGPGTAGPASAYNDSHPARIAENFFLQIGQETGWLGLALFVLINFGVGYLLWIRRDDPLALSLFASLIGITFVNLLSHAWADDTLSYLWWGLAGIAMVPITKHTEAGPIKATKPKKVKTIAR
jgi:hypothetical protein